jgi:hypothetical protein
MQSPSRLQSHTPLGVVPAGQELDDEHSDSHMQPEPVQQESIPWQPARQLSQALPVLPDPLEPALPVSRPESLAASDWGIVWQVPFTHGAPRGHVAAVTQAPPSELAPGELLHPATITSSEAPHPASILAPPKREPSPTTAVLTIDAMLSGRG